jgi:preprotein translocase subunit SecG
MSEFIAMHGGLERLAIIVICVLFITFIVLAVIHDSKNGKI